mmetsp:Transcript_23409/g.58142  ORF Transcript_23409/g.58142 Transcript_23409/m.58142 type:complete len:81 (+) Transcript_23409:1719-1961(+)
MIRCMENLFVEHRHVSQEKLRSYLTPTSLTHFPIAQSLCQHCPSSCWAQDVKFVRWTAIRDKIVPEPPQANGGQVNVLCV